MVQPGPAFQARQSQSQKKKWYCFIIILFFCDWLWRVGQRFSAIIEESPLWLYLCVVAYPFTNTACSEEYTSSLLTVKTWFPFTPFPLEKKNNEFSVGDISALPLNSDCLPCVWGHWTIWDSWMGKRIMILPQSPPPIKIDYLYNTHQHFNPLTYIISFTITKFTVSHCIDLRRVTDWVSSVRSQ